MRGRRAGRRARCAASGTVRSRSPRAAGRSARPGSTSSGRTGPCPTADVRERVPDELEIEEHDGSAWLSIVFFRVRALRARGVLPVPGISTFLQLNVRTYVRGPDGLPGVWFFSIDASSRLAALGVRRIYHVPAFHARMTLEPVGEWQEAECVRVGEPGRVFAARYRAERRDRSTRSRARSSSSSPSATASSPRDAQRRDAPRPLAAQPGGGGGRAGLDRAVRAAASRVLPLRVPAGRAHLAARADRL